MMTLWEWNVKYPKGFWNIVTYSTLKLETKKTGVDISQSLTYNVKESSKMEDHLSLINFQNDIPNEHVKQPIPSTSPQQLGICEQTFKRGRFWLTHGP